MTDEVLDVSKKTRFNATVGCCRSCKGIYPLLVEVKLCKTCIILGQIPYRLIEMGNPKIIVPLDYRTKKEPDIACAICLDNLETGLFAKCFRCSGNFHSACYKSAGNVKCPICHEDFSV